MENVKDHIGGYETERSRGRINLNRVANSIENN